MGTEVIKALLIDEALDNAQAMGRVLSQSIYPRIAVVHGDTLLKSLGVLQTGSIDVAVVALSVFENAAFDELTLRFPHCPIVVAAEPEREADAIRALDAGAQDYFVLGQDSRIAARVIGFAAERARLQADLDSARSTLAAGAARLDAITPTPSTAFFAFDRQRILTFAGGDAFTSDLIPPPEITRTTPLRFFPHKPSPPP